MDADSVREVLQAAAPLIVAVVAVVGALRGPGRRLERLKAEAELLRLLEPGTEAHTAVQRIVDKHASEVETLISARRDWGMFAASVILAPVCTWGAIQFADWGGWIGWPLAMVAGLFAVLFVYGIFETWALVPRDAKGKRIET